MSFELFVAIILVGTWAALPLSLIIASRDFDDEIADDGKIVEIGSFLGRSTHYLATALVNAGKENVKIYAIDTFEGSSEHVNLKLPKDFSSIINTLIVSNIFLRLSYASAVMLAFPFKPKKE